MNIWILAVGEPLPGDDTKSRLHRAGLLSQLLVENGHNVTWWSSTFNHSEKKLRAVAFTEQELAPNFRLKMLHGIPYHRNISLARLRNHAQIAKQFAQMAPACPAPDLIFCAVPTIELAAAGARYAVAHHIPFVLDMRDMWPDIFLNVGPRMFRPFIGLAITPLINQLKFAASRATAIFGITPSFVKWGLGYAGREWGALDRDFPLAYSDIKPSGVELSAADDFWKQQGIDFEKSESIFCFFGAMGRQFDLDTVIRAADGLRSKAEIKFVLCGNGDYLDHYRNMAKNSRNVIFPGWINHSQLWTLLRHSCAGLAPYHNSVDFMMSYPNKPIEYFSAGVPVLSCLKGDLKKLVDERRCGLYYEYGNERDLAEKVCELTFNPDMRSVLSRNAYDLYGERFMAKNVYRDMELHFEKIVNEFKTKT